MSGDFPDTGVALITGGSGGIGAAIAVKLAEAGADCVIAYNRNRDAAETTLAAVREAGADGAAVAMDLRDADAVRAALDGVAAAHGGIHTLVSAHGPFIHMKHVSRIEPELFREIIETDVIGAYNLIHAAIPHLRASRGVLVAMTTPAIRRYTVKDLLSSGPKAAIEQIVKGVAMEEGRFGVRANTVGVGMLTDGMYQALVDAGYFDERFIQASLDNLALGRLGTADEIAEAAVFLASNRARYITGQTLMVDGGYAV